jgi:RNA polymerase sigma-70 factor (ECF subfamily)
MAGDVEEVSDWLEAAHAGSTEALGRALEACRGYLLLIAQQELEPELRAKGGASDLVQETFVKAHRHFDRFRGDSEADLLAWLRRLLLNNLADFRAQFREADKRRITREVSLDAGDSWGSHVPSLAAQGPSPSDVAMEHEDSVALSRTLSRLPDDYRLVLQFRHDEGRTFEEIGPMMERSADAVRKLWARAVERLQQEWEAPP